MKKENWLKPVTKEDVREFAFKQMNLKQITALEEMEDVNYGKFYQVSGLTNEPVVAGWAKPSKHLSGVALGEYGPLDVDQYGETTVDDMGKLFSSDESLINIYLAWVVLVSSKNQGRKIDGKTYSEGFSNACNAQIDLKKNAQIRDAEREAYEKKNCVKEFAGQLEKVNENQQEK